MEACSFGTTLTLGSLMITLLLWVFPFQQDLYILNDLLCLLLASGDGYKTLIVFRFYEPLFILESAKFLQSFFSIGAQITQIVYCNLLGEKISHSVFFTVFHSLVQ